MNLRIAPIVPLCLLFAGLTFGPIPALAQSQSNQPTGPSKYLYISNNIVRAGHFGDFYKTEADEVQARRTANAPGHYIGTSPVTGVGDVVFFYAFDSFDELQKNHDAMMGMSQLMDRLHADNAAEAPMLSDQFTSIYQYQPDLSLHVDRKVEDARFLDITIFHVKSGHHHDFEALVKVFAKAQANNPDVNWAAFQKMYGQGSDDTYIMITLLKSLADVDQEVLNDAKLPEAMGKNQLQLNMEMGSMVIKSSENDILAFNPKISYVPDHWLTEQPDFWGKK
jgi:hypothetical protein